MKYKIWNKTEEINGVSADIILENNPIFKNDDVFLILDDYDTVMRIESCKIIKSVYGLDKNMTVEKVADHHVKELKKQQQEEQ